MKKSQTMGSGGRNRPFWVRFWAPAAALLLSVACATEQPPPGAGSGEPGGGPAALCASPAPGCSCNAAGTQAACGKVHGQAGDYVFCSEGQMTCAGGKWGDCIGERIVTKSIPLHTLNLGDAGPGCATNVCDPYCSSVQDTPQGLNVADSGLAVNDAGLTLAGGSIPSFTCTGLTVTPATQNVVVTRISPIVAPPASLVANFTPAGCFSGSFPVAWSVDNPNVGTFTTSTDTTSFQVVSPIAATVNVTAFAYGLASAPVAINVTVKDTTPANNGNPPAGQVAKFSLAPNVAEPNAILYPYPGTYFPLGLMPPVLQWTVSGGAETTAITLRSPVGTGALFTWTYYLHPENAAPGHPEAALRRFNIPKVVWDAFTSSTRGADGEIVIQRTLGGNVKFPRTVRLHVIDGQLKGTIYYNAYNSPIATAAPPATASQRGGILAFRPGIDTVPRLAVTPGASASCLDCHSVSADGHYLISDEENVPGGGNYARSFRWDLTSGAFPITATVNAYPEDAPGDGKKLIWGGQYPDGSLVMSNVGDGFASNSYTGQGAPWSAPKLNSMLYATNSASPVAQPVTNWPTGATSATGIQALQSAFSPDGRKLAFIHQSGAAVNGLAARGGRALTVTDFGCGQAVGSVTCTGAASVTNARYVYNDLANANYVTSPSFAPNGASITYQVATQVPFPNITGPGNTVGTIMTWVGTQAEIWGSPSAGPAGSAKRFDQLNGYKPTKSGAAGVTTGTTIFTDATANFLTSGVTPGAWLRINGGAAVGAYTVASVTNATTLVLTAPAITGVGAYVIEVPAGTAGAVLTSYLPYGPAHTTGVNFSYVSALFGCASATTSNFTEEQLNYQPSVNPVPSGGNNWVVFTSRRLYGNIAVNNPWEDELGCIPPPSAPTKQLWMAAYDQAWVGGNDPSHPPLYLEGQELPAGNSRSFWAQSACTPAGAGPANVCAASDDCCPGSTCAVDSAGPPVVKHCRPNASPTCNPTGGACLTPTDCCTPGSICAAGKCTVQAAFSAATFTREYIGNCLPGSKTVWHLFKWNATESAPTTNASIAFSVQTRPDTMSAYAPAIPIALATANSANWNPLPAPLNVVDVQTALAAAGLTSRNYLLLTMRFSPSSLGTSAPILQNWTQEFDCVPNE